MNIGKIISIVHKYIKKLFLLVLLVLPLIAAVVMYLFYREIFPGEFSSLAGDWGAFGDFFGGLLNPIVGYLAVLGILLTLNENRRLEERTEDRRREDRERHEKQQLDERRYARTLEFIEEFHSRQFIEHRIAIWYFKEDIIGEKGPREVEKYSERNKPSIFLLSEIKSHKGNTTSMWEIVIGYVHPIAPGLAEYVVEGDVCYGLSCHEHLTLYIGFYHRVGLAIEAELVDVPMLKEAIGYSLRWNADFMLTFIECIKDLTSKRNIATPDYVKHVDIVYKYLLPESFLSEEKQSGRIGKKYRNEKLEGMPQVLEEIS
jgi:uncharacterized membrane protein